MKEREDFMDNRPIGIFDSGIGGITVLKQVKAILPNERYIYLGDTKYFPYGEKSKEEIIKFTRYNIQRLIEENVKMVIIACGTATSQALDVVKEEFDIPIIGIIEPTAKYIAKLNLNKIGIIATTGTIRSGAWERSIKEKSPNIQVVNKACPLLAGIAEQGLAESKESLDAIHKYMQIFKDNQVTTIVLGCTHYPIYDKIIKKEFEYEVNLINTGYSVANDIKKYLEEHNGLGNSKKEEKVKFILTEDVENFYKKVENILKG